MITLSLSTNRLVSELLKPNDGIIKLFLFFYEQATEALKISFYTGCAIFTEVFFVPLLDGGNIFAEVVVAHGAMDFGAFL